MMGDGRAPYAASTRRPALEDDRAESFSLEGAEAPDDFRVSAEDEQARQARLSALPVPKPEISGEERGRLIAGCADAVMALSPLIYGAGDLMLRRLSDEIALPVEECERLVREELARRTATR